MGKFIKVGLAVGALALVIVAAGAAASKQAKDTFVFGTEGDPVLIDGAYVADGPSLRVIDHIFDTLVELRPGTTKVVPSLATSWTTSKDGLKWTFNLRKGVRFTDGTPLNAAAVCFNFNRWYNWRGPFQDASASYYYRQLFGGFRVNEPQTVGVGKPLYKSCRGIGRYVARITLNRRSGPFVPSLVLPAFAMQSPKADFPMLGRAATMTRFPCWKPEVRRSRSRCVEKR